VKSGAACTWSRYSDLRFKEAKVSTEVCRQVCQGDKTSESKEKEVANRV